MRIGFPVPARERAYKINPHQVFAYRGQFDAFLRLSSSCGQGRRTQLFVLAMDGERRVHRLNWSARPRRNWSTTSRQVVALRACSARGSSIPSHQTVPIHWLYSSALTHGRSADLSRRDDSGVHPRADRQPRACARRRLPSVASLRSSSKSGNRGWSRATTSAADVARDRLTRKVMFAPGRAFSAADEARGRLRFDVARCGEPSVHEVLDEAIAAASRREFAPASHAAF